MFTAAETAYLRSQFLGRLATRRADGTLQNSPVGFRVNDNGTIDIGGRRLGHSAKWRNVVDNGEVAFVVDDLASTRPWRPRGVELRGRAEALAGQEPVMAGMTSQVIRVHPRWIFSWGLGEDGGPRRLR
jgi:pyridoxamine 5'-phosphate oxidase family protein